MGCAPRPVAVRLGNVTLSNGMAARGMNMSLGEPPQPLAFLPLWPLNNTIIYGTDGHCLTDNPNTGPWTDTGCTTFRGGAYDELASASERSPRADDYPADDEGNTLLGNRTYPKSSLVSDRLVLNNASVLENFPLRIARSDWGEQAYSPMMGIGLGTNSTLLNMLRAGGQIASRSYSYFWGSAVPGTGEGQLDGGVVFGGYDRAKVSGRGVTLPMTDSEPECQSQLVITVSDMVLNFANGTDASIFPASSSSAMSACLTPGLPTLARLPLDPYFDTMLALMDSSIFDFDRSQGIYYWNMLYPSSNNLRYDGDLTIKLQSGLSVRIANDQLVMPHTEIDQTTGSILVNTSTPDFVIDSLQSIEAVKLAHFGWQFFTAAYLLVNQDTRQFTLWSANPTTDVDLVAVDATGTVITDFCTAESNTTTGGGSSGGGSGGGGSSSVPPVPHTTKTPVGAIVGGTVGGIAVAVLVVCLVWWLCRRRRRRRPAAGAAVPAVPMPSELGDNKGGGVELDGHAAALPLNAYHDATPSDGPGHGGQPYAHYELQG